MFHPQGPTFWELARQALSSTQRGYDLLAPKFDFTPFRTPDELLAQVAPHIGEPASVESALDVCCGTGAGIRMLRPLCRDQVVGIDFSQSMLDVASGSVASVTGSAEVRLICHDVLTMEFDQKFDVAVCFGALGHIRRQDERRFVDRVARSLAPGGRFIFITTDRPSPFSAGYLLSRSFNFAMRLRNLLVHPPFVMYYLTFLVPDATLLLEERGFKVDVHRDLFSPPFQSACLVVATLSESAPECFDGA